MVESELVAKCHDLGRQGGSRPEENDEGAGQEAYQGEHPGRIQGEGRLRKLVLQIAESLCCSVRCQRPGSARGVLTRHRRIGGINE